MELVELVLFMTACGLFISCAWSDFQHWKIPNTLVVAAICLYLPYAFASGIIESGHYLGAFAAGSLLFTVGFILWLFRKMGAGDAKLFFPIGLYIGWPNLMPYAFFLFIFALGALLILRWPLPATLGYTQIGMRINEIRTSRKVPYGVVMVAAFLATTLLPMAGSSG